MKIIEKEVVVEVEKVRELKQTEAKKVAKHPHNKFTEVKR